MTRPGGPAAFAPETVPVREAATVALVRDARVGGGLEVFLQHRVSTMQFAAGMSVFPGGGVEPRDYHGTRRWRGPEPAWWAEAFGIGVDRAAASVRGVARELFEETGVLLAEPGSSDLPCSAVPSGRPDHPGTEERRALDAGEGDLDSLLAAHGLVLSAHLLRPWDRWTTPLGPPRRYDTLFFVAAVPEGAEPDGGTTEARATEWMRADDAAAAGTLGRLGMLRPTLDVLADLATVGDVAELLRTPRVIAPGGR